jgi:hypothetical protein
MARAMQGRVGPAKEESLARELAVVKMRPSEASNAASSVAGPVCEGEEVASLAETRMCDPSGAQAMQCTEPRTAEGRERIDLMSVWL